MKQTLKTAIGFSIAALVAGVYFREFTKWNHFTGKTSLSLVHPHLLALGVILVLLFGLLAERTGHSPREIGKIGFAYGAGLIWTTAMMLVRGTLQVLETPLSKGMNAMISGVAGIGHILLGVSLVMILVRLMQWAPEDRQE